ncbi:formate/nitrite transporter [Klebsiella michiganensis]|uniref:Formate/nitrite transporter n=1 Tax=Klebsiella michiganensis TaxID=1134687 RepID=A0A7H4PNY2_9ENTR|nr:formate/nitrite transporter [Klebsiella michiganensis]
MPVFDEPTREAFLKISLKVMQNPPLEMFANAIISGWLVATMVWMFPAAGSAKIVVIILMTWLIALADTTHIVVGSVEIFYLVFNGTLRGRNLSGLLLCQRLPATYAAGPLFSLY